MLAAWIGAALVGLSLGLLGSGGSILTVPVLVYLAGRDERTAVLESLVIVGAIAATGALVQFRRGRVDLRWAAYLVGPGLVGAWFGAALHRRVPAHVTALAFALLVLLAAFELLRRAGRRVEPSGSVRASSALLAGAGVGLLTGFLGVGGGFLIVPVLVLFARLPLERATGTSLVVIAANAFAGFVAHGLAPDAPPLDLELVGVFTALGIAGSLVGLELAPRLPAARLQRVFALLLALVGCGVAYDALR